MHIPDGFLSPAVAVVGFIISAIFLAVAVRKVGKRLDERMVPLMALLTALFFAAQMMNYPVVGGTTAHLLGGAVLGIVLGPWAGCISMTVILVLQCFLFADGGITALGANILTMGIVGVFVPFLIYSALSKLSKGRCAVVWLAVGAFLGDVLAAIVAGILLGLSTPVFQYGLEIAVPAMALHHSVIGAAEAVITVAVVLTLVRVRPEIMSLSPSMRSLVRVSGAPSKE